MRQLHIFLAALALTACSPIVDQRGHVSEVPLVDQITVGQTTQEEVLQLLGSPSTASTFGDETWYYVAARKERTAFFKPEITDQHVTQIVFDASGTVTRVKQYDENDGKELETVRKSTPTAGHKLGFFEQIIGNLGRFNKPKGE